MENINKMEYSVPKNDIFTVNGIDYRLEAVSIDDTTSHAFLYLCSDGSLFTDFFVLKSELPKRFGGD